MKFKLEKRYKSLIISALIVIVLSLLFYFLVEKFGVVNHAVESFIDVLKPFIYGLIMAYLLCPLYNFIYRKTRDLTFLHKGKRDRSSTYAKTFATIVSIIVLFAVIVGVIWMIVPGLVESLQGIVKMIPDKMQTVSDWLSDMIKKIDTMKGPSGTILKGLVQNAQEWVKSAMVPNSSTIIDTTTSGLVGFVSGIKNFVIGVVICIYFLNSKEIFAAQSRKLMFSIMQEENAYSLLKGAHYVNKTFGNFINGKLIDSLIIGVLTFVWMMIVGWPYPLLISVIIGVTNIIPFFGPFIGAIPSALLIFMVSPITALYFLIFIIVLQQLDGNILGPKIYGESIGLPSFWVMFALLVGGGIFGFIGMIIGIPIFACIYAYVSYVVDKRLTKKGLAINLTEYRELERDFDEDIKNTEKDVHKFTKSRKKDDKDTSSADKSEDVTENTAK